MTIRTISDPYGSPDLLIDELIGKQYPIVKHVSDNMGTIKHVSFYMPQLFIIHTNLPILQTIYDKFEDILAIAESLPDLSLIVSNIPLFEIINGNTPALLNLNNNTPALFAARDYIQDFEGRFGDVDAAINAATQQAELSLAWATGTLPGGPGTFSSREYSEASSAASVSASGFADNAANSALAAAQSLTDTEAAGVQIIADATAQKDEATTQAGIATTQAGNAATSASAAADSVVDADEAADLAHAWADGTEPGGVGTKSSKEWAEFYIGKTAYFDTLALAQAATIPTDVLTVITGGRLAAGDNMGAAYKYVAAGAASNARFTSANGRIFQVNREKGKPWNMNWFGLNPANSGADNDLAWAGLISVGSPNDDVVINAGTYTFATTSTLFPFQIITVGGDVQVEGPNIVQTRATVVKHGSVRMRQTGAAVWKKPNEQFPDPYKGRIKENFINASDGENSEIIPQTFNNSLKSYNNALFVDAWTASTVGWAFTTDTAIVTLSSIPDSNISACFDEYPEVGAQYSCGIQRSSALGSQVLVIRTENSWIMYYPSGPSNMSINVVSKLNGAAFVSRNTRKDMVDVTTRVVSAYNMDNASLGVYISKHNEYTFTINGMAIEGPIRTVNGETILSVGWGVLKQSGDTGTLTLTRPVKIRNATPPSLRPIDLLVFGDSFTDPINVNWVDHMIAELQGSLGCQINRVLNVAISGARIAEQATAISAQNLSKITLAVGLIGVNDIRLGTALADFKTSMDNIINTLDAAFVPVVFATPSQYYSQAETTPYNGSGGINVVLQDKGSPYRETMMHTAGVARLAGKMVHAIDSSKVMLPSFPQFQQASQPTGSIADSVLTDNIHPTMRNNMSLAHGLATAVVGLLAPKAKLGVPAQAFKTAWFRNTWEVVPSWQNSWSIDEHGVKHLRIYFRTPSTTPADYANGVTVMQLPKFLAPKDTVLEPLGGHKIAPAYSGLAAVSRVQISLTGEISVYGVDTTSKWIACDIEYI